MAQRLTPLEVSLLALDTAHIPEHVGTVAVLQPGPADAGGLDLDRVLALVANRVAYTPRYRQRVVAVPGRLAAPVWVDDDDFDLSFHVRPSALPRPGTPAQLREHVAALLSRRLDRSRPLWELYVVEGLEGGRVALVEKVHLALVDGGDTVDLAQVLLDSEPTSDVVEPATWHPALEPSPTDLVVGALWESAQDPVRAVDNLRGLVTGTLGVALAVGEVLGGTIGASLGTLAEDALRGGRPPAGSPLAGPVSQHRRFATARLPLADLQAVHAAHGHTVNDVVLAALAGALRAWLLTRGQLRARTTLRALVPMSVLEDEGGSSSLGVQVAPHLQDLPVGEANALMRLHQVAYGSKAHRSSGRAVDARTLTDIAGFAPATLHALGVRVAAETVRRPHDLLITNVPGPQVPLFAGEARLEATYPVVPLGPGHLLAIGVTSYDGDVYVGLTADRAAVADLDVLVQCLEDAVDELVSTTRQPGRRQPTRAAKKTAAGKTTPRKTVRKTAARKVPVTEAAPPTTEPGDLG
ncbi:wax ester/triacylglycerol synthase family O-acyltransferase [Microlunatus flavus]|uniref:Diacylglycerol O-acyltransferase n=1 Tax=Microlunatus flavus TaxID=1036181 RepID=A0A1H9I7Y8_9ACTN|nr:wax ester/triacylglycerol synthase family O-acyltransferase [Microlunatus flavus]SEQ70687.1 diacylglycerol O-acyltransferase [Microlunatus flavus]